MANTDDGPRRRLVRDDDDGTATDLVPLIDVDRKIRDAIASLRRELAADVDRAAIARATRDAEEAAREARAAASGSRRRFGFALACLATLLGLHIRQCVYAVTNRERIEHIERIDEARRTSQ